MKLDIFGKVKPTMKKIKFGIKEHSPEILVISGVIGVVASAVMACVSTTKIKGVVDNSKNEIKAIHQRRSENPTEYVEHDMKKDLTSVYFKTAAKFVKLYAPAVILGGLSITGIVASNAILKKRAVALAAAYATVDKSFKDYRSRVVERFGEQTDRELKYGIQTKTVKEKAINPETGKEVTTKKEVEVTKYDGHSDYARYFDNSSVYYNDDLDYNLMFLKMQNQYANDKLVADGYLFLNDVYDALGLPKTKAGQIVGWVYDKDNPQGDNYIDFGIQDYLRDGGNNNFEPVILLDFNVDGPILNRANLGK